MMSRAPESKVCAPAERTDSGLFVEFSLSSRARFLSLLLLDLLAVSVSLLLAVLIGDGIRGLSIASIGTVALVTVGASALIFVSQGLYKTLIRYMSQHAIWDLIRAVTYSAGVFGVLIYALAIDLPRSAPLVYWLCLIVGTGGGRLVMRACHQASKRGDAKNVLIYGAGESGRQLLNALFHGREYRVVAFVDDNPSLQGSVIAGLPVLSPQNLEATVEGYQVGQVLLAIPSATHERRRQIINSLVGLPVHVRTVPKISELVAGRASVNQIQDVDLDDLLGRDPVPPHPELIDSCITDKVVMVTGAGGSIGAELCRQIIESSPRELILFDISEFSLYSVERELKALLTKQVREGGKRPSVVTLLGSVRDERRLEAIFRTFGVDTVYHAAAYKHVPMVEYNIAEGVANNVEGTWCAARAADHAGVGTFVLVSTDKAVRPTNVMGASKRFAELVLQGLAETDTKTRFCMVRFGNVLGSSGSVVPLFRDQIERGGPVTVTHPEVSRYFMSIREAAQLVLQAGAMGTGGDVFVLDMGEPVRIVDLAKRMIRLSGYEMVEGVASHPDQIGIEFIGLRPGEKLHEELLLGTSVSGTGHPMIMRAEEDSLDAECVEATVTELLEACRQMDCNEISRILKQHVVGFSSHEARYDYLWIKQGRVGKRARKSAETSAKVAELPIRQRV
jgi:FlaA1/EpsC-like NDP-sugar epimerase